MCVVNGCSVKASTGCGVKLGFLSEETGEKWVILIDSVVGYVSDSIQQVLRRILHRFLPFVPKFSNC